MTKLKECIKCKLPKTLDLFDDQHGTKDGLRGSCKACVSIRNREYHTKNRVKLNNKRRQKKKAAKLGRVVPAVPVVKKSDIIVDVERIKAIMSVPVNPKATHYYYLDKTPMKKEQELGEL